MNDESGDALVRRLRALPELDPPADGYARLRARLGAPRTGVRPAIGWAVVAATTALTAVVLLPALERLTPPPATAPAAAGGPDLAARSAELERLLAALPPARTARASTALTAALLEDRIALVDERLSAAPAVEPADQHALLRERVVLLDSLVRVRYADSVGQAL
ncbi:MAG: hypothetical protein JSR73_17725 [Proteobacteria bacterium]|nr:hypothetical protein [Pseudomonadota bacterium]